MFRIVPIEQPILCYKIRKWIYWDSTVLLSERDPDNDFIYTEDS